MPTEASKTYVRFDSLGAVLLVMPWNYPLWQVLRAAIPAMAAGNGILLKHVGIVTGSSLGIEDVMDTPMFRSVVISDRRGGHERRAIARGSGCSDSRAPVSGDKADVHVRLPDHREN